MNKPNTPLHRLNYEPALLPSDGCITIRDTDACLQITFGASAAWIIRAAIIAPVLVVLGQVIGTVVIIRLLRGTIAFEPGVMMRFFGLDVVIAAGWFAVALYWYAHYRKWRRVPGTLTVEAEGITFVRPGWWNLRRTFWPAASIKRTSVRRLKPLFGTKAIADFRISVRHRLPRRFRLTSRDPAVIDTVEIRISMFSQSFVAPPAMTPSRDAR